MQPYLAAKFWKRMAAGLIDAAIIYVHTGILTWLLHLAFRLPMPGPGQLGPVHFLVASSTLLTVSWLYFAVAESSALQASLGKLALGLMVTDLNGGRLSFHLATGRFLRTAVSLFLLLIPYSDRTLAHTRVRTTLVVNKKDWLSWQLAK